MPVRGPESVSAARVEAVNNGRTRSSNTATLRRIGTREVFERAATWCKSVHALERARGADILSQLGKTAEHRSNMFPEESYAVVSQMLQQETEVQPLSSAIHALGHLNNPAAIPLLSSYRQHPVAEVRFALACALGSFANDPEITHMHASAESSRRGRHVCLCQVTDCTFRTMQLRLGSS